MELEIELPPGKYDLQVQEVLGIHKLSQTQSGSFGNLLVVFVIFFKFLDLLGPAWTC